MRKTIVLFVFLCFVRSFFAQTKGGAGPPYSWREIGNSYNASGLSLPGGHPLQYNPDLNSLSFIHCSSLNYPVGTNTLNYPGKMGAVAGVFTKNWGNEWDSTLLWYNEVKRAYYPQGALYSGPGKNAIMCSSVIACGALKQNNAWSGSFFATKKLDSLGGVANTNTLSGTPGDLLVYDHSQAATWGKFDFPCLDFVITDDGKAHTLGILASGIDDSITGWVGASIVSRNVSETSAWRADTLIPQVYTSTTGKPYVNYFPHMAWNSDGSVGYVWFTGVRTPRPGQGDTLSNMGMQPIVYKTNDGGSTWLELPRINFNDQSGSYDIVLRPLDTAQGSTCKIPYFNEIEGIDGTVDRNNRLHIVSTILSTGNAHRDSLMNPASYQQADGQIYTNPHLTGRHLYLYDFTETATGWDVTMIDSLQTEAPGRHPGEPGYSDNPWDWVSSDSTKGQVGARIQVSRTPNGEHIVYTWADSDTGLTFLSRKWNHLPNVNGRLGIIAQETNTLLSQTTQIHSREIYITDPITLGNPPYTVSNCVKHKVLNYYVSPVAARITPSGSTGIALGLPMVVSNNWPAKTDAPIQHWFLAANLNFDLLSAVEWPENIDYPHMECDDVGLDETQSGNYTLFPNPADKSVSIFISRKEQVVVNVYDLQSRLIWSTVAEGERDLIEIPLAAQAPGIYIVQVRGASSVGNRKLIVQH